MNIIKQKTQDRVAVAAETYQKGWEAAFMLMEYYFKDKWVKKTRRLS